MDGGKDDGAAKGGTGRSKSPVARGPQSPEPTGPSPPPAGLESPSAPCLGGVPAQPRSRVARSPQAAARAASGYAWRATGPQALAPAPRRDSIRGHPRHPQLWIDFIRLQPAVPVGAMAAAKKAERCV